MVAGLAHSLLANLQVLPRQRAVLERDQLLVRCIHAGSHQSDSKVRARLLLECVSIPGQILEHSRR